MSTSLIRSILTPFARLAIGLVVLVLSFQAAAEESVPVFTVTAPFVELRSGPGRSFPVVHSVELNETMSLGIKKTDWIKVQDHREREGWIHIDDVQFLVDSSGEKVTLDVPDFERFDSRRWAVSAMAGEFESSTVNAIYGAYRWTPQLSTELSLSQVLGSASESLLLMFNGVHQPFPDWVVSPFFTLGIGQILTDPKATLAQEDNRTEDVVNWGLGMSWHVADRYSIRLEFKEYVIFTDRDENEEAQEWKIGISIFL